MAYGVRTATCHQCGEEFTGHFPPSRMFCSTDCRQAYRNHPDRNPAKSAEAREKIGAASKGRQACLGRVMSDETRRKIAQSLIGSKASPETIARRVASYHATMDAHGGMSPALAAHLKTIHKSGPAHPFWKGGTTPQRNKEFETEAYKTFRRTVLERDGFRCRWCASNKRLEVHHVLSYAEHPALRFDPDNGLTLCRPCHDKTKRGVPTPRQSRSSQQPEAK